MKFSARSYSPSPARGGRPRRASTFGLQSDSDDDDDLDASTSTPSSLSGDEDNSVSILSSDDDEEASEDDSVFLVSDLSKLAIGPRRALVARSPSEKRHVEETVASIRLRARYHDPYEEWEKQTRRDAFRTARKEVSQSQAKFNDSQLQLEDEVAQQLKEINARQISEVEKVLHIHRQRQQVEEMKLKEAWMARERELWARIETVIRVEEDKVAKKLEEERRKREEEERKRREEEEKRRAEEEKRRREEEERRRAEEEKARKEKEEEEREKREAAETKRKLAEEDALRKLLSFGPADDDWRVARENLRRLKSGPIKFVKGDRTLKSEWAKLRRQIVPKIGQLTNDAQAIAQISQQLLEVIRPSNQPPHHELIYFALLSSLAKSILLQAETEVTAEKKSAGPLAQVAFNLLERLDHFPSIFFAKLVQRCGGWSIPHIVPPQDVDGKPWGSTEDYRKVSGFRKSETGEGMESVLEHSNRVSSMMRVYFHILKIRPMQKPLDPMFQLPRCWIWMARILGARRMLAEPVAPQLIYTALDVLGLEATAVWGKQWMKLLALVHEGITTGYEQEGENNVSGKKPKLIGGDLPEAAAARTRVLVELENVVNAVQSS